MTIMSEYSLRTAKVSDLDSLLSFEQEIIKAERPFDPTIQKGEISYYDLKELILGDESEVMVIEWEGTLVASGYVRLRLARHYLDHKDYGYLGFMYTHPDHRGKGLNAQIVEGLKEWSYQKGIKEVRLTVYSDNLPAVKAYEKAGFKKHIIEMRLPREEDSF